MMGSGETSAHGCRAAAYKSPAQGTLLPTSTRLLAADGLNVRTDLNGDEWDRAVCDFADVCYEQTHSLQSAHWGDGRVRRLAVSIDDKTVAMALLLVFRVPLVGRGLALIKYGPLWRRKGELPDRQMLALVLDVLVDHFVVRQRLSLSVMPPPDPRFDSVHAEELRLRQFTHSPLRDAERFMVNATLPPELQLASLDQRWRRNLRTALKAGLSIGLEEPRVSLAAFEKLCLSMKGRKNYSNPVWPLFKEALSRSLVAPASPVLVLAREKGIPVAGAVVFQIGDTACYAVGASSDRGVEVSAGYALHWWIVNWLRDRQCCWYDLGEASVRSGLRQFKKGLVGKEGVIALSPGEFTLAPDLPGILAAGLLSGARRLRLVARAQVRSLNELLRTCEGLRPGRRDPLGN